MENTAPTLAVADIKGPVIIQQRLEATGMIVGDFFVGRQNATPRWRFTLTDRDVKRGYVFAKVPVEREPDGSLDLSIVIDWVSHQMHKESDGKHLKEVNPLSIAGKAKITKENPISLANLVANPNALAEAWAARNANRVAIQPCITPSTRERTPANGAKGHPSRQRRQHTA